VSEDRRQILGMLADGKITADDAERLIAALGAAGPQASYRTAQIDERPAPRPNRPKYLRVVVEANDAIEGATKVNVRVPMQLLRAGVRLSALIPAQARDQVNAAMARQGIAFDINQIRPENLEELIEQLNDFSVDVDSGQAKVKVFCE
jgi:hypothetical protein